ncbi:MAG TPA: hypothetical protein VLD19_19370 [Chitinophagaceae bacterium]|nr:hypothetical protein [Chitinophagaceae bacterium]
MLPGKKMLLILLSVIAFTVIYLYYVKQDRNKSISLYLSQPQAGDVYKMESNTSEGEISFYLKVKEVAAEGVYFYRSGATSNTANDIFLNHFDSTETIRYGKKELLQLKDGQWNNVDHNYTTLLEISRK